MQERIPNVIILFPGSFSPFTDGHYGLVSRYLSESNRKGLKVSEVRILMSMKERDGIDPDIVYKFTEAVYSNDNRVKVVPCTTSPIRVVYEEVMNRDNIGNSYILARSDKDDDQVAEAFYKDFSKGGKYWYDGVSVIDLDIDRSPIVYKDRNDESLNKPVSGTVARQDLKNNDYNSFKTSYKMILQLPNISERHLKKLFNMLRK
jgi:hypothetical protein